MTPKRKYYKNCYQHVFQISVDRGLIFYTDADCIVFFTILCCLAVKYHIRIASLCIMKNHFHILGQFVSADNMELYLNALCSVYARKYNSRYHRKGKLFKKPFGSAPKYADDIYDCAIYVYNNPIPKKAVEKAIGYRWNFLAYLDSRNPFSKQVDPITVSKEMKERLSSVEKIHSLGQYIDYTVFYSLVSGLNEEQYQQLLDHIISIYNIIDYRLILSKWNSKETVSEMLSLVKGSDYDSREDGSREDYKIYEWMNEIVRKAGFDLSRYRFDSHGLDPLLADRIRNTVIYRINPSTLELDKYFHSGEYARTLCPKTL